MITRRTRNKFKDTTENSLKVLLHDLTHDEVYDTAVNLYSILNGISSNFSSDAIIDLVPEIVKLLNRLDATLKVNGDLTHQLKNTMSEIEMLKNALEKEKRSRQDMVDTSISYEQDIEREKSALENDFRSLQLINQKLFNEIKEKNEIVNILLADQDELNRKLRRQEELSDFTCINVEESFKFPKLSSRKSFGEVMDSELKTTNKFAVLSQDDSVCIPSTTIQVQAVVHEPRVQKKIRTKYTPPKGLAKKEKCQNNILILSDSHGKGLSHLVHSKLCDTNVTVWSKPGAKLKHILREGHSMAKKLSSRDLVIIMGGTNDTGRGEPSQLTISQGMKDLLSWNISASIVVTNIPYRHDQPSLNNNIHFLNGTISKMIQNYRGILNISNANVTEDLHRRYYTRHGLHFNKAGKRLVSERLAELVKHINCPPISSIPDNRPTTCHVSLDTIEPFPDISNNAVLMSTPAMAHQQPHGVSITCGGNTCMEESFLLSLDEFPPLPKSPVVPVTDSHSEPELYFLEVGENFPVIN